MQKNTGVKIQLSQGHPAGLSLGGTGQECFWWSFGSCELSAVLPVLLLCLPATPGGQSSSRELGSTAWPLSVGWQQENTASEGWCVVQPWLGQLQQEPASPSLVPKSLLLGSPPLYFKTKQSTHTKKPQKYQHENNPNQELTAHIWAVKNRCLVRRGEACGCSLVRHRSILKPMPQETGQNATSCRRSSVLQRAKGPHEKDWGENDIKLMLAATDSTCYIAFGCCVHWDNLKVQ